MSIVDKFRCSGGHFCEVSDADTFVYASWLVLGFSDSGTKIARVKFHMGADVFKREEIGEIGRKYPLVRLGKKASITRE